MALIDGHLESRESDDRILQVLHDDALQVLAAACYQLEGSDDSQAAAVAQSLRHLSIRLRGVITGDLDCPSANAQPTLATADCASASAIEEALVEDLSEGSLGTPVLISVDVNIPVNAEIFRALRHILRQAVGNACEHSNGSLVGVSVSTTGGWITGVVEDDGVGASQEMIDRGRPGHIGIASMRLWANRVGGTLEIRASPTTGTRVEVTLPASPQTGNRSTPARDARR